MARFVHITDARDAAKIRRNGLHARRALFCVPMAADPSLAFQWARELRRCGGYRTSIAIVFAVDDDRLVTVGRFNQPGLDMTAAEAVAFFHRQADPRGFEIRIAGTVAAAAVKAVRRILRNAGWRFYPEAKGRHPLWPSRGEIKAHRLRRAFEARYAP